MNPMMNTRVGYEGYELHLQTVGIGPTMDEAARNRMDSDNCDPSP